MTEALFRFGRQLSASALLLAGRLAGAVIGLLTQVLLARMMPAAALGLFFFAMSLAAVLSVVAAAGYPQATARFMTRYRALARNTMAAAFFHLAARDIAVLGAALAAAAALAATSLADRETAGAVALAAAAVPVLALGLFFGAVANTEHRFFLASLPEFLLRPIGLLSVVLVFAWLAIAPSVLVLLTAFALLCTGVTVVQAVGLRRADFVSTGTVRTRRSQARLWRTSAAPLVLLSLFTALFADVAVLVASPFLDRADLAVFAICLKITFLIGFAVQVTHQTVMPGVAEELHRKHTASAQARVRKANIATVAVTVAATAGVFAFGDRLLALFDPAFASAHNVLTILVASQAIRATAGPAAQMLTVVGRQKIVVATCPAALALLCLTNAILVPLYGLPGAACAILLTITVWSAGLAVALAYTAGLRSFLDLRSQARRVRSQPA